MTTKYHSHGVKLSQGQLTKLARAYYALTGKGVRSILLTCQELLFMSQEEEVKAYKSIHLLLFMELGKIQLVWG